MFEEKVFWDIVNRNKNKVIAVDFELVTPNMSNISAGLSDDLKALQKTTNTQKTNLKLQSDKDSSLDLSENNNLIGELVTYASRGGGNIKCKIRGYKRSINTSKNIKQESADEIIIENSNSKNIGKNPCRGYSASRIAVVQIVIGIQVEVVIDVIVTQPRGSVALVPYVQCPFIAVRAVFYDSWSRST